MPSTTYQQEIIEAYQLFMLIRLVTLYLYRLRAPDPELEWQLLLADLRTLLHLHTTHVLCPGSPVPKVSQFRLLQKYAADPCHYSWFEDMVRVSPYVFNFILNMISDHVIFTNNSNQLQAPIELQLAITLYCLGHYGNSADVWGVAHMFGCSEGLVAKATDRCFEAIDALHDLFVWPLTEEEKEIEKQ
uniref:Uncharacterized protein n=1 Tax=Moniliophthora roreri TaxID=221103 RepID=A0A0W0GBR8_MONRR